jgi:hypothetical protein
VGRGRPRRRPVTSTETRATTTAESRTYLRGAASPPARIARLGIDSAQRLGPQRWVVERALGWLPCKRLALRHDRTAATITVLARDDQFASRGPTTCPGRDRTGRIVSTGSTAVTDVAVGGDPVR